MASNAENVHALPYLICTEKLLAMKYIFFVFFLAKYIFSDQSLALMKPISVYIIIAIRGSFTNTDEF